MRISHWLTRLQNYRPARKSCRRMPRQSTESLERRTLLTTVGILTGPTELTIFVDDGDAATVQRNVTTGNVEVLDENGQAYGSIPSIQASQLTSLNIFADDAENALSVAPVNAAEFSMLNSIVIESGNGDDVITGSDDFGEMIDGGDGADTIIGGGGDDTLDGGDGDDSLLGGAGQDSIIGDDGQDTIDGGADADDIDAGDGQDSVDGGDGDDTINAGDGLDTVDGGAGADFINGMSGTDLLNGGADNDTILGGNENDTVNGGDGNDIVNGQAGNDMVNGDAGDDTAYGGGGHDSLSGGDGDDIANGQSGHDILAGNSGMDRIYGGSGGDVLDGGAGDDTLRGHSGDDTVFGGAGNDFMTGDRGRDLLISGTPEIVSRGMVTVEEGNSGTTSYSISVELNQAYPIPVSFNVTPTSVTALADSDFDSAPISITFAPGQLFQSFNVGIVGDTIPEPTELFDMVFSPSQGFVGVTSSISIRINDDDQFNVNVSRSTFNQTETSVQSNPVNPSNILASGTDLSNATQDTVWQSLDGGLTWAPVSIPNSPGAVDAVGDTALAFNSSGTAFFAHGEAYSIDPLTGLPIIQAAVATSVDSGTTWTTAVVPLPTVPNASVRDISLTVGPDPITPGIERLYLSYEVDGTQYAQTSLDGVAWSSAVPVQDAGRGGNVTTISGPDGTLYALWQEIDPLTPGVSRVLFDRSVDGGLTWGADTPIFATTVALDNDSESVISDGALNSYLVPSAADYGAGSFVSAAVDRSNSAYRGRIYVVVSDQSDQDGVAATQHDDTDLFLISSDDQGQTWSAPLLINDDASGNTQLAPEIAVDQSTGDLVVAWYDARLDDASSTTGDTNGLQNDDVHVFVAVSFDGGASFESNLRLSAAASNAEQALLFNAEIANRDIAQWSSAIGGNDHWFDVMTPTGSVTWDQALSAASGIDGYLGTLVTQAENDFVFFAVIDDPLGIGNGPWIGAMQNPMSPNFVEPAGGFEWITGETFTFTNWGSIAAGNSTTNEPNNGGGVEDRVLFLNASGTSTVPLNTWHDAGPTFTSPLYLVEFDHNPVALDYGDHIGLTIQNGAVNVAWANNSNSTGDNPDGTLGGQDIYLASLALRSELTSITVSPGNDTILGGTQNDTIVAGSGDDLLDGNADDDIISGGGGNDSISGGDGNDTIDGGAGDDTIAGQGGDDLVTTGSGIDMVLWDGLGNGTDTIVESDGAETLTVQGDSGVNNFDIDSNGGLLRVTEGAASITVAASTTTVNVNGGSEDDVITISSIADVNPLVLNVDGQADDDTITALDANIGDVRMFLNGGTGNDTITGSRDDDSINGDGGDDSVFGGLGNDSVDGGDGNDTLNGEAGNDTLLGNLGNDMALGGDGDDSLSGGFGNDTLVGEAGNDSASGGFGNDVLNGNSGNDLLAGGQDDDKLLGGSGDDSLDGDSGDDTLRGQSDSDLIKGGDGNDVILGDSGNDVISGGDGDDDIDSGNGDDIVTGADGNDTLNGMSGDDTLLGGDGNDNQLGGSGLDSLYGENGDDSLNGGGSTDQFNGGEGADVLVTPDAGEFDDNSLVIETSVLEALELLNGF